jgi:hypothetical protein
MYKAILAMLLSGVCPALAQTANLIARVYNKAGVPPAILRRGEVEASYVLQNGGVQVLWNDCEKPHGCDSPLTSNEFAVLLRSRPARPVSPAITSDALGVALVSTEGVGIYAVVYYDQIQRVTEQQREAGVHELLGYVIAHEIGHLLLGPGHHPGTIMKDRWTVRDLRLIAQRQLHFKRTERDLMQAALRAAKPRPQETLKLAASLGLFASSALQQ